jgi:hypothetical protein
MDVYLLTPAEGYRWLVLDDDRVQVDEVTDGRHLVGSYSTIRAQWLSDRENGRRPLGDFPPFSLPVPVMSRRAVDALGDLLDRDVELLPLDAPEGSFFAANVTNVADALDVERSEVKRFRSGRIMRVLRYELRREAIEPAAIFKLVEPRPDVYVTDAFRDAVEAAGLEGLDWDRLVWSDDPERATHGAGRLDLHV